MHHAVALAGTDDRDVIDAGGEIWKQVRDFDSALAVFPKRAPGAEQLRGRLDELILRFAEFLRARLARELVQQRLRIECLHVARSAGHEQENDRLRLRRKMR